MLVNDFSVLYSDDLTGESSDTPVHSTAFGTNKKATQYILRIVIGGLSLVGILIYTAALSFLIWDCKVVIKADNGFI